MGGKPHDVACQESQFAGYCGIPAIIGIFPFSASEMA
jgi:hypothetical protein